MKLSSLVIKYLPLGVASGTLAMTMVLSPIALARHGAAEATTNTETTTTEAENEPAHTGTTSKMSLMPVQEAGDDSLRSNAKSLLENERKNHKEHTTAQRQQACEAHKTELTKREANYAVAAQRHLDVFNSIFTKVQAFQTSKQLNVPDYDTLVAAATAKQTAAQAAVDSLKALDVTIDCTQTDPASSVATLKTAVKNARTALQDYRAAIKDVIVALKGASTSTTSNDSTSTGGNQ